MTGIRAKISGVHGYVPEDVLSNFDLEKMVDTNDEWIRTRTGIEERRILRGHKATSDMAVKAAEGLLEKTNTKPEEIDFVVCSTITPDHPFPATANILSHKMGIKNAFSYDLSAACSGFLYALETARRFVESGGYKKVLVVSGDKMSSIIDYKNRETCIIFGDGVGAVLVEPSDDENGIMDSILFSDGFGAQFLHTKSGGSLNPTTHASVEAREHFVYQEGKQVFKYAVKNMADVSMEIMERNGLAAEDVAWLVPHQANKRIIDATANRMGLGMERVMVNIQRYGNTTNGTIPLCLWDYEPQLNKGDNIIISTFGGGFTWGSIYLKWAI